MTNPNPKTEQLALGRAKRPKLNHQSVSMRMSSEVKQRLEEIAELYGCFYGGKPQISKLLEKIALEELMVVPAPPNTGTKKSVRERVKKKHYREASGKELSNFVEEADESECSSLS